MEKKYCKDIEQLSKFAKALGHPPACNIAMPGRKQGSFFSNINECLPISKATVSQHLAELKRVGAYQGCVDDTQGSLLHRQGELDAGPQNDGLLFRKLREKDTVGSKAPLRSDCR